MVYRRRWRLRNGREVTFRVSLGEVVLNALGVLVLLAAGTPVGVTLLAWCLFTLRVRLG